MDLGPLKLVVLISIVVELPLLLTTPRNEGFFLLLRDTSTSFFRLLSEMGKEGAKPIFPTLIKMIKSLHYVWSSKHASVHVCIKLCRERVLAPKL